MTTVTDKDYLEQHGEQVERVKTLKFLSSMIFEDGSCKQVVVRRMARARTTMPSLQRM